MSTEPTPYRYRVAEAVRYEFAADESLLAATRFSLPHFTTRVDPDGKESNRLRDMPLVQRFMLVVRPPPRPVPGFPVSWDMVAALTERRVVLWKPRRGTHHPGELLGALALSDLRDACLQTVRDAHGHTLAAKFIPRHGPLVMLDVVAGFRADSEHFMDQLGDQLQRRDGRLS